MKKNNKAIILIMTAITGIILVCFIFAGNINIRKEKNIENIDILSPADM